MLISCIPGRRILISLLKELNKRYMKTTLKCLIFFLPVFGFSQTKHCVIKILVDHDTAGTKAVLVLDHKMDTAYSVDGKIVFDLQLADVPIEIPMGVYYKGRTRSMDDEAVYVCEGSMEVHINNPSDSVFKPVVTGPPMSVAYEEQLSVPVGIYNDQVSKLYMEMGKLRGRTPIDTIKLKEMQATLTETIKKCFEVPQVYIRANPNSPLSLVALRMLGNGQGNTSPVHPDDLKKLFASLTKEIQESPEGIKYKQKMNQ
jgi:hypothetical protein